MQTACTKEKWAILVDSRVVAREKPGDGNGRRRNVRRLFDPAIFEHSHMSSLLSPVSHHPITTTLRDAHRRRQSSQSSSCMSFPASTEDRSTDRLRPGCAFASQRGGDDVRGDSSTYSLRATSSLSSSTCLSPCLSLVSRVVTNAGSFQVDG
jgi:hypothetical protein